MLGECDLCLALDENHLTKQGRRHAYACYGDEYAADREDAGGRDSFQDFGRVIGRSVGRSVGRTVGRSVSLQMVDFSRICLHGDLKKLLSVFREYHARLCGVDSERRAINRSVSRSKMANSEKG